jgi:hypothetical protein
MRIPPQQPQGEKEREEIHRHSAAPVSLRKARRDGCSGRAAGRTDGGTGAGREGGVAPNKTGLACLPACSRWLVVLVRTDCALVGWLVGGAAQTEAPLGESVPQGCRSRVADRKGCRSLHRHLVAA